MDNKGHMQPNEVMQRTAIRLERATDRRIDRLVHDDELYELTDEEIGIVEGL